MPTLEIATVPLVAGSDIGDPNNQAAAIIKETCDTIADQEGFQSLKFGMEVENPTVLQMFIDWDSKQSHLDFMAKDIYQPFIAKLKPILGGAISVQHQDMKPDLQAALKAPVTEVATFYFDGSPPSDAYESTKKFIEICEKDAAAKVSGWAYGITQEEIEKDGVKGYGAVLAIGWETVEAHMEFRTTEVFKENVHLLRQNAKGIEMHHVRFMNYVR